MTFVLLALMLVGFSGCASSQSGSPQSRPFQFHQDTFAYANELQWIYEFDPETGQMTTRRQENPPEYTQRCFPVSRSARQFFDHAVFEPGEPRLSSEEYRELIRQVVQRNPRAPAPDPGKIHIPGYPHLRAFSEDHEAILKEESGAKWQSYLQRGNWRVVFPFTRRHQNRTADQLAASLEENRPPVIHLIRFPQLTINHALLLYGFEKTEEEIHFMGYDPNDPEAPVSLIFDRHSRKFLFQTTRYFPGGEVNVYEIYRSLCY